MKFAMQVTWPLLWLVSVWAFFGHRFVEGTFLLFSTFVAAMLVDVFRSLEESKALEEEYEAQLAEDIEAHESERMISAAAGLRDYQRASK